VHTGLASYMRCVIASDTTTKHKPDPEPVMAALERLEATAGAAVFVGDSPYDMQAARAAGVHALGVAWGAFTTATLHDAGAEVVLERPADLVPYLQRYQVVPPG
jgi:phosphoglycolate phosphatase-like HAD superfamily hydrolase